MEEDRPTLDYEHHPRRWFDKFTWRDLVFLIACCLMVLSPFVWLAWRVFRLSRE